MEKDQKIENKLAECCQNLLSNLERGDILNIPIFSLKLRQLLASVEKKYGLENENVPIGKVVSVLPPKVTKTSRFVSVCWPAGPVRELGGKYI